MSGDIKPAPGSPCECEHASHFPKASSTAHYYGTVDATKTLKTLYGTYEYCDDCEQHMLAVAE